MMDYNQAYNMWCEDDEGKSLKDFLWDMGVIEYNYETPPEVLTEEDNEKFGDWTRRLG